MVIFQIHYQFNDVYNAHRITILLILNTFIDIQKTLAYARKWRAIKLDTKLNRHEEIGFRLLYINSLRFKKKNSSHAICKSGYE